MSEMYAVSVVRRTEGTREKMLSRCLARGNARPDLEWHLREEDGRFVELELIVLDIHPDAGMWFDAMFALRLMADAFYGKRGENPIYERFGGFDRVNNLWFEPRPDDRTPVWLSSAEFVELAELPRSLRSRVNVTRTQLPARFIVVLPRSLAPGPDHKAWTSAAYSGEEQLQYRSGEATDFSSYASEGYRSLAFDGRTMWATAQEGCLIGWDPKKARPRLERTPCPGLITSLAVEGSGALWAFDNQMVMARRDPSGQWQAVRNRGLASTRLGTSLGKPVTSPKMGRVWIDSQKGLLELEAPLRWHARSTLQPIQEVPEGPHWGARSMAFHPDGGLWIGVECGGVERIGPDGSHVAVSFEGDADPPARAPTLSEMTFSQDGTLWASVVEDKGKVYSRSPEGKWTLVDKAPRYPSQILETRQGELWFGLIRGLYRRDLKGRWKKFCAQDGKGLISNDIMSMAEDGEGLLWVGTDQGVCRQTRTGTWEPLALPR